jgi:glycosyltransferase involved in cell wall biosynthesis
MAAYNTGHVIRESIDSIVQQTFTDWELLVVDDGSTDNTFDVASSYDDPRIKVIRLDRNRGRAGARNEGLRQATGRYIAICDSDDLSLPERFERQLSFLRAHTDVDVVGTQEKYFWGDSPPVVRIVYPLDHEKIRANFNQGRLSFNCGSALLEASIFQRFGGYDENFRRSEDGDFFFRIRNECRFATLPDFLMLYRHEIYGISPSKWFETRWYQRYACYRNGIGRRSTDDPNLSFDGFARSWSHRLQVYGMDTVRLLNYTLRSLLPTPHVLR